MVPDGLLLHLHGHTHTEDSLHDHHKAEIAKKHTHCPVEDLFGAPYHGSVTSVAFRPATLETVYIAYYNSNWQGSTIFFSRLRGPPLI
nr:hypothetical protein [Pontibacter silvestris]